MHNWIFDIISYINHPFLTGILQPSLLLHWQSINVGAKKYSLPGAISKFSHYTVSANVHSNLNAFQLPQIARYYSSRGLFLQRNLGVCMELAV